MFEVLKKKPYTWSFTYVLNLVYTCILIKYSLSVGLKYPKVISLGNDLKFHGGTYNWIFQTLYPHLHDQK